MVKIWHQLEHELLHDDHRSDPIFWWACQNHLKIWTRIKSFTWAANIVINRLIENSCYDVTNFVDWCMVLLVDEFQGHSWFAIREQTRVKIESLLLSQLFNVILINKANGYMTNTSQTTSEIYPREDSLNIVLTRCLQPLLLRDKLGLLPAHPSYHHLTYLWVDQTHLLYFLPQNPIAFLQPIKYQHLGDHPGHTGQTFEPPPQDPSIP